MPKHRRLSDLDHSVVCDTMEYVEWHRLKNHSAPVVYWLRFILLKNKYAVRSRVGVRFK